MSFRIGSDWDHNSTLQGLDFVGKQATQPSSAASSLPRPTPLRPLESAEALAGRRIRVFDSTQGEKSYQYLVHNLPAQLIAKISAEFEKVTSLEIIALMEAVGRHDYKSTVFKNHEKYPYVALKAVKEGKMSEAEFSTVMFYWSLANGGDDVHVVPLFSEDGQPNLELKEALLTTCHSPKNAAPSLLKVTQRPFATPEQINAFFEKAHSLPSSQQFVFITRDNLSPDERCPTSSQPPRVNSRRPYITSAVRYNAGFNFFDQFEPQSGSALKEEFKSDSLEMMGSFAAYQLMGQIVAGEDCVALRPVIGLSTVEEIHENGATDQRDLGLPFPEVKLPDRADEYSVGSPERFIRHDLYHFFITCRVSSSHRKALTAVADEVQELLKDPSLSSESREFLKEFYERVIDMEFPNNRPEISSRSAQDNANFLVALSSLFILTAGRIFMQGQDKIAFTGGFGVKIGKYGSEREAMIAISKAFSKDRVFQKLAERLLAREGELKERFGVELSDPRGLDAVEEEFLKNALVMLPETLKNIVQTTPVNFLAKWLMSYSIKQVSLPHFIREANAAKAFESYTDAEKFVGTF